MQELIIKLLKVLETLGTAYLFYLLFGAFVVAVLLRALIYYTVRREWWFARELDKRTQRFLSSEEATGDISFYVATKRLLEKTFYELFEVRAIMKRRRPDPITSLGDRIFLINEGAAWLVKDTLRQIKFLKHGKHDPDFMQVSKNVFQNNRCFNNVFGLFPAASLNEVVNILPGLMVIGGIFGTFLGIMAALPQLKNISADDIGATKIAMETFVASMAFALGTSIVGILLSVLLNLLNSMLSPERLFIQAVERFENVLAILWSRANDNSLPEDGADFNEHKDPFEALAEQAVNRQLSGKRGFEQENRGNPPPAKKPEKAS